MKKAFFLLLLVYGPLLFSQNRSQKIIDSLEKLLPVTKVDSTKVNVLNNLASEYLYINSKKSLKFSETALSISKKINWNEGISRSSLTVGSSHYAFLDYSKALQYYNEALKLTFNKSTKAIILQRIAVLYSSQSNFTKSIEFYFKTLEISEAIKDKPLNAKIYTNIGTDYSRMGNFKKTEEYFQKALKIHEELKNKNGISLVCQNLGNLYYIKKQEDKAIENINRSVTINDEIGNTRGKVYNLESLTSVYFQKADYNNAFKTVNEAIDLAEKIEDEESISYLSILLGDVYVEKAKKEHNNSYFAKAEENYLRGLEIHKKMDVLQELAVDYEKLSKVQSLQKKNDLALENFKIAVKFKDSVFNSENKETIKNLEDKREIDLRDKQIELNTLTIETNKKQKLYLVAGLILFGIIGSLLFYQNRTRRKNNLKLRLLNSELDASNTIKTKFLSILNHDLRSPVNNLLHFLHLIKNNPELLNDEDKRRMIDKNAENAENLLASMDDILLWSKDQISNFGPKPKQVSVDALFENIKNQFSSFENIAFHFENLDNIHLTTDEDYLKTIMRNLTANAVKVLQYKPNASIIWKAWKTDGVPFVSIEDNGIGNSLEKFKPLFDEHEISGVKTGLGLHLIRDLAKAIHCKITLDSKENIGTTFVLEFN